MLCAMQLDASSSDDVLYFQKILQIEMTVSRGKIGEMFKILINNYAPKLIQNFIIFKRSSLTDHI